MGQSLQCPCAGGASLASEELVTTNPTEVSEFPRAASTTSAPTPRKVRLSIEANTEERPKSTLSQSAVPREDSAISAQAQPGLSTTTTSTEATTLSAAYDMNDDEARAVSSTEKVRLEVETFMAKIVRCADEDAPPDNERDLKASGWSDISKPSARIFYRMKKKEGIDLDCVGFKIKSIDQLPSLPLFELKDRAIRSGVLPTLWAVQHYNLWFPFCTGSKIIKRFSPECCICQIFLKVLFYNIDFVVFLSVHDYLKTKGFIQILMKSAPAELSGKVWLDVQLPPEGNRVRRVEINLFRLKLDPKEMDQIQTESQLEMVDFGAPRWLKVFLFQQLSLRIMPQVSGFQKKIPGSPLDSFLNGSADTDIEPESKKWMLELHDSIERYTVMGTCDTEDLLGNVKK